MSGAFPSYPKSCEPGRGMANGRPCEWGVSAKRRTSPVAARSAFTLVELLVVIGIIALLVGILLPSLIAARRQARLIACQSNLRQLATACLLHAHDHRGYMPLAGRVQLPESALTHAALPAGLNGNQRQRYTYARHSRSRLRIITAPPAASPPY